jgi:phosphatidylglycerol:prolipoprotein diacylglycerol transferase
MLPVLFKIGNFPVHSFGVVMVIAFFAALMLIRSRAGRYGLTPTQVSDVSFWTLIGGVLGARAMFIIQELPYYLKNTDELFSLQFKGLTSFGGLFVGAAVVAVWARRNNVPFRTIGDLFAPGFLLGHIIGRVGCLLNGCCFGGACPPSTPWGIHVEGSNLLHHPAQIYDSLMNLAALGFLLWFERRKNHAVGQVAGLMFVLHGLARFIYEFWRAGTVAQVARGEASSTYWGSLPITQAQAVAIGMMVFGAFLLALYARRGPVQQELRAA